MEFLSAYVRNIAFFLIFSSFVEIILPDKKYRDYIHLILGLILILIILEPLSKKNNWSADILTAFPEIDLKANQADLQPYVEAREQMVMDLYESRLHDQIADLIESEVDYRVLEIETDIRSGTGEPLQITMLLSPRGIQPVAPSLISIREVELAPGGGDSSGEVFAEQESDIKIIKNIVSDFYNLSVDNIHIRVHKKSQE